MKDKRIGVVTGSCFDTVATEQFPDAQLYHFSSMADMITALKSGKIDAYLHDEPLVIYVMGEDDGLTYVPETLVSYDYAFAFPKTDSGRKLRDEMSAYLRQIKSDGTMDRLQKTWFLRDEENWKLPDYEQLPATNGKLVMATDATVPPFTMVSKGRVTGLDINIVTRFCEAYGYGLTVKT